MQYLQLIAGPEGESWSKPAQSDPWNKGRWAGNSNLRASRKMEGFWPPLWWSWVLIAAITHSTDPRSGKRCREVGRLCSSFYWEPNKVVWLLMAVPCQLLHHGRGVMWVNSQPSNLCRRETGHAILELFLPGSLQFRWISPLFLNDKFLNLKRITFTEAPTNGYSLPTCHHHLVLQIWPSFWGIYFDAWTLCSQGAKWCWIRYCACMLKNMHIHNEEKYSIALGKGFVL